MSGLHDASRWRMDLCVLPRMEAGIVPLFNIEKEVFMGFPGNGFTLEVQLILKGILSYEDHNFKEDTKSLRLGR
jgi:hypothetical protein